MPDGAAGRCAMSGNRVEARHPGVERSGRAGSAPGNFQRRTAEAGLIGRPGLTRAASGRGRGQSRLRS